MKSSELCSKLYNHLFESSRVFYNIIYYSWVPALILTYNIYYCFSYLITAHWNSGDSKHQSSGMLNERTKLLLNFNVMYTPKPNKNIIIFIVPFNIYNYSSNISHQPSLSFFFQDCSAPLNNMFKLPLHLNVSRTTNNRESFRSRLNNMFY